MVVIITYDHPITSVSKMSPNNSPLPWGDRHSCLSAFSARVVVEVVSGGRFSISYFSFSIGTNTSYKVILDGK
jgi:hypothetical protein